MDHVQVVEGLDRLCDAVKNVLTKLLAVIATPLLDDVSDGVTLDDFCDDKVGVFEVEGLDEAHREVTS